MAPQEPRGDDDAIATDSTLLWPQAVGELAAEPDSADRAADLVHRHVAHLVPVPARSTLTARPLLPSAAVVLTATPDLIDGLGERAEDPLVLSSVPCADGARRRYVADLSAEGVAALLNEHAPNAGRIRLLTDLEALLPAVDAPAQDWSAIAALHDLLFLTLQLVSDRLDSVLALFLGADDGVLHPFAGLFSGLLKSASLEFPDSKVACVFTSARSLGTGLAELATEACCDGELPLAVYRQGTRHVVRIREEPATPGEAGAAGIGLGENDVVVAVGHGITALLLGVVAAARPTIYVVSSTDLDVGANLADLERRCGAGKVHYRQADVVDTDRLAEVIDEIFASFGRVDLLISAAGGNGSGTVATTPLSAFRQGRDSTVGGYCGLRAAFVSRPPRMWCSFSSFVALTGQIGQADSASADDFLVTAAAAARCDGRDEFAIGWTLRDTIGTGAHPGTQSFPAASVLSRMSTAERRRHFAAELSAGNRGPAAFHLGAAERAAISDKAPKALVLPATQAARPAARFYLDRVVSRTLDSLVAERLFTTERDSYLAGYTVAGVGTLPGLFVPEMAAEAALDLVPGMVVTGFRDIAFEHCIELAPSLTSTPRRIIAMVTAHSADSAMVAVEVRGDLAAPDGRVLRPDIRHFRLTVVLARDYPPAARWAGLGDGRQIRLRDPYHARGSPCELGGEFVSTTDTRVHPLGKLATYLSPVNVTHPVYRQFVMPSLLLDGLARVGVLGLVCGRYIPVAAPSSIRRIDLFEAGSDAELAARYSRLDLSVTPAGLDLEEAGAPNRFVACAPDGHVVAQMHDVRGIVLGFVDAHTGERVERHLVEALAAPAQPFPPSSNCPPTWAGDLVTTPSRNPPGRLPAPR